MLFCVGLATVGVAQGQTVAPRASVDRETIRANESFTYVLRGDARFPGPGRIDPRALGRNFDILGSAARNSRLRMVGGDIFQESEWHVTLMPRGPGRFELPPISFGGVESNSVVVEVLPALDALAENDIFIEVELDPRTPYVQAQSIFTLRLFVAVGTGHAELTVPAIADSNAVIEKLGDDRDYQTVRGSREYHVHERRYAIFPQSPGPLRIGPDGYEAIAYSGNGSKRHFRLSPDVVALEARPAVAPPSTHPDAVWLPATDLRIEEVWSDGSTVFEQGVPKTRTLTVIARGALETQLPEIQLAPTPGLRQYADRPELRRQSTADGVEARRAERITVAARQPGSIELPPIELPWWNVEAERWEVARLPGTAIDVRPGATAGSAPGESRPAIADTPAPARGLGFWLGLGAALGLGWLATIAVWWLRAGAGRAQAPQAAATRRDSKRSLVRRIGSACRVNDARRVRQLLLDWGRLAFASDPPTSLGVLASRVPGPLAAEIRGLEAALYGPDAREWRGEALRKALEAAPPLAGATAGDEPDPLAPLYR